MTDFRALCAELAIELEAWQQADDLYSAGGTIRGDADYDLAPRAHAALGEPEGEGADHASLITFAYGREPWATWLKIGGCLESAHCELSDLMTDVLARWGRPAPAPKPIPVSERLPEDVDCLVITTYDGASRLDEHYCYLAKEFRYCGRVLLIWELKPTSALKLDLPFTYWLPASTRFLPTTVDPACAIPAVQVKEAEA